MSYILEALKRSEQAREEQSVPTLTDQQSPTRNASNTGMPQWAWILIGLNGLLLVALLLNWMQQSPDSELRSETPAITDSLAPSTLAVPQERQTDTSNPAPIQTDTGASPKPRQQQPQTSASGFAAANELADRVKNAPPRRTTLTREEQQWINSLEYSSHIYSDERSMRSVTINGQRLSTGDWIDNRAQIITVTERGIVLELDGIRQDIDVVSTFF